MKLSKDSQVIDSDFEEIPTFSAWASLVTAVSLKVDVVSSDTQLAIFHDIASKRWSSLSHL